MPQRIDILFPSSAPPVRLDLFLAQSDLSLSRSHIQHLIEEGRVWVNDQPIRSSFKVRPGDRVVIQVPDPEPYELVPEAIPLEVLFEDPHLMVVNKPPGMVVHPGTGIRSGTLVNALLYHCDSLSGINGVLRPGIVHRLDKDTSGLLVVAKNDRAHRGLSEQLQAREFERLYMAFVWGHLGEGDGRIEAPIGRSRGDRKRMAVTPSRSRDAATRYKLEGRFDFLSHLSIHLETGRTHQIRVHLSHIGHPVFGDPIYGGREKRLSGIAPEFRRDARRLLGLMPRQALHAGLLGFVHPATGKNIVFESDPPGDMKILEKDLYRLT